MTWWMEIEEPATRKGSNRKNSRDISSHRKDKEKSHATIKGAGRVGRLFGKNKKIGKRRVG